MPQYPLSFRNTNNLQAVSSSLLNAFTRKKFEQGRHLKDRDELEFGRLDKKQMKKDMPVHIREHACWNNPL
ncbi:unnamed protein product [Rhizopus microsporus]